MVQVPQRAAFSGPTLVRLLAGLSGVVTEAPQSLSDRLSQWLGWTDAIALSTALNGNPPAGADDMRVIDSDENTLCTRARTSLTNAIAGACQSAPAKRGRSAPVPVQLAAFEVAARDAAAHYAECRQRYLSAQQLMEMDIGNLRGRLRTLLAEKTPAMARLAEVDAVMEQALGSRERSLLAGVPALLKVHFERLHEAEHRALSEAQTSGEPATVTPGAWLNLFRKDMQSVLLAELEVRFQPVEGLLAALRTR